MCCNYAHERWKKKRPQRYNVVKSSKVLILHKLDIYFLNVYFTVKQSCITSLCVMHLIRLVPGVCGHFSKKIKNHDRKTELDCDVTVAFTSRCLIHVYRLQLKRFPGQN